MIKAISEEAASRDSYTNSVRTVCFSQDNRFIASSRRIKVLKLDPFTGELTNILNDHNDYISNISFDMNYIRKIYDKLRKIDF